MYFRTKYILKNNSYHTLKYPINNKKLEAKCYKPTSD